MSWESCERCKAIEPVVQIDFLDGNVPLPPEIMALPEMRGVDFSQGWRQWDVRCELCGTQYVAEVDVEPLVWEFELRRVER